MRGFALIAVTLAPLVAGCGEAANVAPKEDATAGPNAKKQSVWGGQIAEVRSGYKTGVSVANDVVTDADLAELADLVQLESLILDHVKLSDAGLAHLAGLKALKTIRVLDLAEGHVDVGDAGLESLGGLTELEHLAIPCPKATNLAALAKMTKLKILNLGETAITDDGLKPLANVKNLDMLRVGGPKITNAGLAHIAAIPNLTKLILLDTAITDDGLSALHALAKLESLYVYDQQVTDAGLSRVTAKHPEWHVHLNDEHVGGHHD